MKDKQSIRRHKPTTTAPVEVVYESQDTANPTIMSQLLIDASDRLFRVDDSDKSSATWIPLGLPEAVEFYAELQTRAGGGFAEVDTEERFLKLVADTLRARK